MSEVFPEPGDEEKVDRKHPLPLEEPPIALGQAVVAGGQRSNHRDRPRVLVVVVGVKTVAVAVIMRVRVPVIVGMLMVMAVLSVIVGMGVAGGMGMRARFRQSHRGFRALLLGNHAESPHNAASTVFAHSGLILYPD